MLNCEAGILYRVFANRLGRGFDRKRVIHAGPPPAIGRTPKQDRPGSGNIDNLYGSSNCSAQALIDGKC